MCILLLFKVNLHSDLLFLDSVAVDLFVHGGAWSNWKITPAAAYFPDMLAYVIAYFLFPYPPERIVFVSMVQAFLLAWACMYLARVIKPSFSKNAKMAVLMATSAVVLVASHSSMWLFFDSTNNHFASLFFPLLCFSWLLLYIKKTSLTTLLLIISGVAIGTASTSIFTISFTAPALLFLAGCIVILRAQRTFRQSAFKLAAAIVAGHVVSSLLQRILLSHNALEGRPLFTLEAAQNSIKAFISATRVTFGPENIYTLALAIFLAAAFICVVIDWILSVRISVIQSPLRSTFAEVQVVGKNSAYTFSVAFLILALPVNIMGAVLSGGFGDDWGYRYFTFPITLGLLLCLIMFDYKSAFDTARAFFLGLLVFSALTILGILSVKPLMLNTGRTSVNDVAKSGVKGPGDIVGECIHREANAGFVFEAGIGDFWNARGLSYKTEKGLYILPVINDGTPFFHMMTLGPLLNPQKYGIRRYNFVAMRKSGTTSTFDDKPETLGRVLPPPARIVSCADSDTELWLYSDSALDTAVRKTAHHFLGREGILREYEMVGNELPGTVGKVQDRSRVAEASKDAAGYLSYGPYIAVPPGRYQVVIAYTSTESGNKWDAGRFNIPEKSVKLAEGTLPAGNGKLMFSFQTGKSVSDFEIRTWFGGRGRLAIHSIRLQPATSGSVGQASR